MFVVVPDMYDCTHTALDIAPTVPPDTSDPALTYRQLGMADLTAFRDLHTLCFPLRYTPDYFLSSLRQSPDPSTRTYTLGAIDSSSQLVGTIVARITPVHLVEPEVCVYR